MIRNNYKVYKYAVYGELDDYGQPKTSAFDKTIKMSIYPIMKGIDDNPLYSNAEYIGYTFDDIDEKFVIEYHGHLLKVLYVINERQKVVYMGRQQ